MWRAQNKPLLYFYKNYFMHETGKLRILSQHTGLYVKNVGNGPAIKVKFNLGTRDEGTKECDKQKYYSTLSPGESSMMLFAQTEHFHSEVTIDDITYNDLDGFEHHQKKVTLEPEEPLNFEQSIELIGHN